MKIIIVSKDTKNGLRYYAYHRGVFSFLHVFCFVNQVFFTGDASYNGCVLAAKAALTPPPPRNTKIISVVDIKI